MRSGDARDEGLVLAIKAAGSVSALARGLGISQPSVSAWSRIPAERVVAVEGLTGVRREFLRPDLYGAATMTKAPDAPANTLGEVDETDKARADEYMLLALLLGTPPKQQLLDLVAGLGGDASPLGLAHIALADAASATTEGDAGREYFNIFVGVGRGEVLQYGSYYLTGFLHERPLARVREDLARLGIQRKDGIHEPEDQLATLLEVMAGLIAGDFRVSLAEQKAFFDRHVKPWAARCFADIAVAPSAEFYKAVGNVGRLWVEIEAEAFELPD
jgi:TorA maturation chaperone TorD